MDTRISLWKDTAYFYIYPFSEPWHLHLMVSYWECLSSGFFSVCSALPHLRGWTCLNTEWINCLLFFTFYFALCCYYREFTNGEHINIYLRVFTAEFLLLLIFHLRFHLGITLCSLLISLLLLVVFFVALPSSSTFLHLAAWLRVHQSRFHSRTWIACVKSRKKKRRQWFIMVATFFLLNCQSAFTHSRQASI